MSLYNNYFLEDGDLLDSIELLREFEDANGPVADEDAGDSDFSMDDAGEATPAEETPEDAPAEDTPEDEEFSMDDEESQEGEENQEEEPSDESEDEDYEIPDEEGEGEENPEGEEGTEDEEFSMDDTDSEGESEEPSGDVDDTLGDDSSSENDNINPKLKDLESVIFDELSEEEKKLKIRDLKELYVTVYKKCGTISELLSDVKRDEETIQIVEYISNTLIDLKQYVNDYINDIFDSKTYVENLAQLQKYIMIFNAINKVFDQIKRENEE